MIAVKYIYFGFSEPSALLSRTTNYLALGMGAAYPNGFSSALGP